MAKKGGAILVRLINVETGYFKVTKRNAKANKLSRRCYDPIIKKHVMLTEKKI